MIFWYSLPRVRDLELVLAIELAVLIVLVGIGVVVLVGYWLRRGESQRALQARLTELQLLSDAVNRIASATLDEDELIQLVHECARQVVDVSHFQLGLFEDDHYVARLRYVDGVRKPVERFKLSKAEGIVGWLRESAQPLLVRDFQAEIGRLPAQPSYNNPNPPRSAVFVPMVARDVVIGALILQSHRVGAYNESHLRLLSIIANQAAAALQNARALQRERRRARQMEAVGEVARSTAAIFDLRALLPRLVESVHRAFGCDFVGISLVDDFRRQLVCQAATHAEVIGRRCPIGEGLIGVCVAQGQIIVVDELGEDSRCCAGVVLSDARSQAVLPLRIGERVIGALDLQSVQPGAFSREEAHYLEALAQQVATAIEEARLYEQSLERQQLERELDFAREIQVSFLPRQSPRIEGWSICSDWKVARHVGGDFYDYLQLPSGDLGVVIADVVGKGVPAALFMVMARTLTRAAAISPRTPEQALARVNQLIRSDSSSDLFVTILYAQLNPRTGEVRMSSAGHNPPIYCDAHGNPHLCRMRGIALGVAERVTLEEQIIRMCPGDVLLLYTDGLIDALNPQGERFGLERLMRALSQHHNLDANHIVQALRREVDAFVADEPLFDDETLVVIKRHADGGASGSAGA